MTSFERLSCTAEEGEGELDGESLSGTHPSSSAHSRMPDAGLALLAHLHALPHVQDKLRHMQVRAQSLVSPLFALALATHDNLIQRLALPNTQCIYSTKCVCVCMCVCCSTWT